MADIAKKVVRDNMPKYFTAELISQNIFTRRATVRRTDALPGEPDLIVRVGHNCQPYVFKGDTVQGTLVEVASIGGVMWVNRIIEGDWMTSHMKAFNFRVIGGDFANTDIQHQIYTGANLPEVGKARGIGRLTNAGVTLWSDQSGYFEVMVAQELFTSVRTKYRVYMSTTDTDGEWVAVPPVETSGIRNGATSILEVRRHTSGVDLRIRRLTEETFGTAGYGITINVWASEGYRFERPADVTGVEFSDAAAPEMIGRKVIDPSEEYGTVDQGPFYDGMKHTMLDRFQHNLFVPDIDWVPYLLKWTGSWRIIGAGTGVQRVPQLTIPMPAVGTTIPVHGIPNTSTVTADGIPMNFGDCALYLEPLYSAAVQPASRLHIVTSGSTAQPFTIPSHWILLAVRNASDQATGNTLMLGDGSRHDYWRGLSMLNGWTAHSAPWQPPAYRRIGNRVSVRGLIKGTTIAAQTAVGQLPVGFRPKTYLQMVHGTTNALKVSTSSTTYADGGGMALQVATNGNIMLQQASVYNGSWVGINFDFDVD